MCVKLMTIGEIKKLAASIPPHLPDDTPVKIEVDVDTIKIKGYYDDQLIIYNTSEHPQTGQQEPHY